MQPLHSLISECTHNNAFPELICMLRDRHPEILAKLLNDRIGGKPNTLEIYQFHADGCRIFAISKSDPEWLELLKTQNCWNAQVLLRKLFPDQITYSEELDFITVLCNNGILHEICRPLFRNLLFRNLPTNIFYTLSSN